jgi:hypothetical protein
VSTQNSNALVTSTSTALLALCQPNVTSECYFLDRTDGWYYHFRRARRASILLTSEFTAVSEGAFCESRLSRSRQHG